MSTLSRKDVAHLARLARLAVTDEELDLYAGQLSAILDAVAQVQKAPVDDVPPTTHAVPMTNVVRADVIRPSLPRDVVLAGAPAYPRPHSALRLGGVRQRLHHHLRPACGRDGLDHADRRPPRGNAFLQPGRGRRRTPVSAPLLVLRAPGGLHHLHPGDRLG